MVATPLGGACLDWANKGIVAADAEDGSDLDISSAAATFRGDSHGKECEYGIEQIPTSSDPLNTVDRTVSEPLLGDDAATISSKNYDRGVIRNLLIQLPLFLGVGCMLLCLLYVCTNKVLFFFVIAVGLGVVFMSNAGLNMGVLLAVPIENRSFAISVNTIFLHAFGDVPAPVIVGLMKDSFAPACSAGNSDDDNVLTSDECRDQSQRLRLCMLLTSLWLLWAQFFFFFGWYAHNTRMEVMPYEKWWSAITRFWRVATCNIFSNNDNRNSDRDRQTSQQSTKQFTGAGELSATYNPVWNGVDPHNPQDEVMANFASDVGSSSAMSGRSIVLKDNLENDAYENFHFGRSSGGSSPTNL